MLRLILIIGTIILLGAPPDSVARDDRGTLRGQVTDAETGEELIGVNITIQGTDFGAATDMEGNYEIRNIRPGSYNVQATYIGFDRMLFTGIEIEAGVVTDLDIEMTPEVLTADDEVVVIGERPIFDIEESGSSSRVGRSDIDAAPVRQIDEVIGRQAGVVRDPTGIYIRGGRAEETGFVVDGVSAQDPLSGTGMGLDLGSGALQEVEVTTGGIDVEHGNVTSGLVSVRTREGGDTFSGYFSHQRDNTGTGSDPLVSGFSTDVYEFNLGGPSILNNQILKPLGIGLPGELSFFVTGQVNLTDEFFGYTADQLESSLYDSDFWSPRMDNRWSGMLRMTYRPRSAMRIDAAYQRSVTVNQNTRMLQVVGDDVQIRPGFQFFHALNLDNANTYTHDSKLAYIRWTHSIDSNTYYRFQFSRLFTRLRADANGLDWRPERVEGDLDPASIVVPPVDEFETGQDFRYVLPGPGLVNNDGLATLWHDHYAEQYTLRGSLTRYFFDQNNRLRVGFEMVFNDYQWIDITRPWVGAPIAIGEDEEEDETFTQTSRLGESSDIWDVRPRQGSIYASDQIRYRGLIANIGARLEYWFPGDFVDEMVDNPDAPIPDEVREAYYNDTYNFFGNRFKMRLLPRISVSFPVRENQMMYFNYGHQTKLPHPSHVYAGLDPFYQDRSFLASLGNPNLDPEVDISYEIGIRNQLTANDALNISAFWSDKYDFITSERILITDVTGREVERAYRVNGDFARVRGLEVTYIKRYSDWFRGNISATYQRAEGLSSTSQDALQDLIVGGQAFGSNVETPLAWDRPWDFRASATFRYDRNSPFLDIPGLNQFQLNISGYYRSGIRYTPSEFIQNQRHPITGERTWRPIYERSTDPTDRFSESGPAWYEIDLSFQKWFDIAGAQMRFTIDVTNLLDTKNPAIINTVTGDDYRTDYPDSQEELEALRDDRSWDVPGNVRDPRYVDPRDNNRPSYMNPANFLKPRHVMFGLSVEF